MGCSLVLLHQKAPKIIVVIAHVEVKKITVLLSIDIIKGVHL